MTSHSPCKLSGSLWLSLVTVRALVGLMYDLWTHLISVYVDMLCCGRKKESLEAQTAAQGRPISGSGIGYSLTGTGQSAGTSADMSTLGSSRTSAVGNRHISPWYDDRSWTRSAGGPGAQSISRRGTPWMTSFTGNSSLAASGANGPVQMGIRSIETYADYTIIETVEIVKRPGQTLGFYIREGNGIDRLDGVFISRIAPCSIVEKNGLLRVGEEIIAVDGVNITRMSLDDVVILMSLPRRLILTVKTHKTCCSKNLSCPALLATPTATAPDQGLIVSGTASAAGWDGKDGTMERSRGGVPDRRVEHQRHWSTASVVDLTDNYAADDHQQHNRHEKQHHHHQVKVDDTRPDYMEHGGNIVSVRQPEMRQFMPFEVHQQQQQQQQLYQEPLTASLRRRQQQNVGSWDRRVIPSTAQQGASYDDHEYGVRRTLRYPLDYSSDTEAPVIGQLLPAEWRRHPSKQGTGSGVVKVEVETTSFEPEWPPTLNGKRQRRSSGTAASGMMTSYDNGFPAELDDTGAAKRHISDSDLNGNGARVEDEDYVSGLVSLYKRSSAGAGAAAATATAAAAAASSTGASSHCRSAADKSSSLPEIENGNNGSTKSDELRHWLRKLDKLSLELQEFNHRNGGSELPASQNPSVTAAEPSTFTSRRDDIVVHDVGRSRRRINDVTIARQRAPSAPETYTAEEYRTWSRDRVRGRSPSTAGGGRRRKSAETTSGERRHLSAADAAPTLPTSGSLADRRLGGARPPVSRPRTQPTSGYFRDSAPSRQEPEVRPAVQQRPRPPPTSYTRTPLNKQPLRIRTEEFRPYRTPPVSVASDRRSRPNDNPPSGGGGIDGRLLVHVYCGHGLRSSPTVLRDLYCVVAVDALNQARTAVQSGAVNFDWDEQFDIDVLSAKVVSFNVYSWTPGTKQTLYFTGRVDLVNYRHSQPQTAPASTGTRSAKFTDNGPRQRLALRLEPSGVLYVELAHLDLSIAYCRPPAPAVVASVAVFGVGLEALVAREKGTMAASGAHGVSRDVPAVVRRCVREVERRGLDAVGVYRLCCATRRKKQLKAELEADVIGVVLSAEHVPDINVVTCVLKDFFIEMPEPLFTNGLYQLLLDAMTVQLTDDPQGNAHMMYGIIDCLPRVNQATLTFMLDHFKRVARKSDVNKMTSSALARVFGPLFVCPPYRLVRHVPVDLQRHADLLGYVIDIWPPTSSAATSTATAAAAAAYR